jgi:hypothetical protein
MKLWTLVLTAAAVTTAAVVWTVWWRSQDDEDDDTDEVDLASDHSFPASDPPSFTVGRA